MALHADSLVPANQAWLTSQSWHTNSGWEMGITIGGTYPTTSNNWHLTPTAFYQAATGVSNYQWVDRDQPRPHVASEYRISHQMMDAARDPDGILAGAYEIIERDIRRQIEAMTDTAWRQWTVRITDVRYDDTTQVLRADARPESRDETAEVWAGWAHDTLPRTGYTRQLPPRPTAADLEEDRDTQRRRRSRNESRRIALSNRDRAYRLRRKFADRRAKQLLIESLTTEQCAQLEEHGAFIVTSERGNRYEIAFGYAGNVHRLGDNGVRISTYCIHGPGDMPEYDHMLAQKLLLETDERRFLRVANATVPHTRASPVAGGGETRSAALRHAVGQVFHDGRQIGEFISVNAQRVA